MHTCFGVQFENPPVMPRSLAFSNREPAVQPAEAEPLGLPWPPLLAQRRRGQPRYQTAVLHAVLLDEVHALESSVPPTAWRPNQALTDRVEQALGAAMAAPPVSEMDVAGCRCEDLREAGMDDHVKKTRKWAAIDYPFPVCTLLRSTGGLVAHRGCMGMGA